MPLGIHERVEARHRRLRVYDCPPSAISDSDSKPDYAMLISAAEKYNEPRHHVVLIFVGSVMREESLTEVGAALSSMGRLGTVQLQV